MRPLAALLLLLGTVCRCVAAAPNEAKAPAQDADATTVAINRSLAEVSRAIAQLTSDDAAAHARAADTLAGAAEMAVRPLR